MKLNHTIERPPIALLPRHGASAHARTSGQATDTARALTLAASAAACFPPGAAPAAAWLTQGTACGPVVPAPVLPARVNNSQEVSLSNCGSKGSSLPEPGRWVASPATNGGSMPIFEWLAKRAVEAVVMAVVVGTVALSLLAMSGEFGERERLHGKKYPDHIITKSK